MDKKLTVVALVMDVLSTYVLMKRIASRASALRAVRLDRPEMPESNHSIRLVS